MRNAASKYYYLTLCSSFFFSLLLSREHAVLPLSQYIHTVYSDHDGLPHNSGRQLIQTKDKYLWIATQDGLVRFNGATFQIFDKENTPAIKHNDITALAEGADSTLWIGTYDGLTSVRNGIFTFHSSSSDNEHQIIRALKISRNGELWVGTMNAGLLQYNNGHFKRIAVHEKISGNIIYSICEDTQGTLWVGTDNGLGSYRNGKWIYYGTGNGLPGNTVRSIVADTDGSIWVGTNGGVVHITNGQLKVFTTQNGLSSNKIRVVYKTQHGILWAGTEEGSICQFSNGTFIPFKVSDGPYGDLITSILEDHEMNLWVGTYDQGINKFWKGKFINYTVRDGLSNSIVASILQTKKGDIWVACPGLMRFDGKKFIDYKIEQSISQSIVRTSLFEDSHGTIWMGTQNGLIQYKNNKIKLYSQQDGLLHLYVRAIAEDRKGSLWIGTLNGGVYRFENGKFTSYRDKGLPMKVIRSILVDHNDNVWIGGNEGVMRWSNGTVTLFTQKDGLPKEPIYTMMEDSEHNIWMGSYGGGIVQWNNDNFVQITTAQGLYNDVVYQIVEDDYGYLWMSGMRGISRVSKQELKAFIENRIQRIQCAAYTTSDGMVSGDCTGNIQSAGIKTANGNLWFPTAEGIVVVNPRNLEGNLPAPVVKIERVTINNKSFLQLESVSMPVGEGQVEFQYAGLSYRIPEKVHYRYKLEGFDKEWRDAGTRHVAFYTNLPPGKYSFYVTACNSDGIWSETGASFTFTLKPHFYQTPWFYLLLILTLGVIFFGIYRLRVWQLLQREKELKAGIDEAMAKIKVLGGLIPICSNCKKIRDDKGYWDNLEQYIQLHSEAKFSHGICPECLLKLYPDVHLKIEKK